MPGPETTPLTDPRSFPLWTRETLRFADTDRLGHVNNAAFATFCESGRVAFFYDPAALLVPAGCAIVIARLVLDFRAEMLWPGMVDVGTVPLKVGRSSFTLGQGLFKDGACVATAETVLVLLDETTRRSTPLREPLRSALTARLFRSDAAEPQPGGS